METLNELNAMWIEAGHIVEDKNAEIQAVFYDDTFPVDAYDKLVAERDSAKARRDAIKAQMAEVQAAQVVASKKEPLTPQEADKKAEFISDFKNLVRGNYAAIKNMVTSDDSEGAGHAGLTIPQDIQTAIHALVRQYDSLQSYVNVENVTTTRGSRVYEKWSDVTPLTELDEEGAKIGDNDDPELQTIKYLIKRYAGITTITNSLLKDTAENILAWLSGWIAKKVVVTRNKKILEAIDTLPTKPTLAKVDDIIDLEAKVDPAIRTTSMFLTNTSGFTALKKVKNALGDYLMQRDVTSPTGYSFNGFPIKEIGDRWLTTSARGAYPLYFGDLKQAVTLFDRENMSLLSTNIGGGAFETDTTKIRVIDRFDVQATDKEAFVPATFTKIADQEGNLKTTTGA